MEKVGPELERILVKRITALVDKARYYPAKVMDAKKAAYDVVKPFLEKQNADDQNQQKKP